MGGGRRKVRDGERKGEEQRERGRVREGERWRERKIGGAEQRRWR